MSDPTIPGGKKLCPSCTTYVGVNDAVCGNCGYNFDTGENLGGDTDAAGTPSEPLTVYSTSTSGGPRVTGQGLGKVIAIVVLVFVLGIGGLIAYFVANTVNDAQDTIDDAFGDIDIPGGGEFTFSPGDIGGGTNEATDYDSCVKLINKYLRLVLADNGQPPDLTTALQDAVNEMGVGYEFNAFTTIYTSTAGTAVTKGTKPALKQAKKETKKACAEEWG